MSMEASQAPIIVIIMPPSSDTPIPPPVGNAPLRLPSLDSAVYTPQYLPYLNGTQQYVIMNHALQPNAALAPFLGPTFWNQASASAFDFSTTNPPNPYVPFNAGSWTDPQQTWAINSPSSTSLEAATDMGVGSVDGNAGKRKAVR